MLHFYSASSLKQQSTGRHAPRSGTLFRLRVIRKHM